MTTPGLPEGIIGATVTPFRQDAEPDWEALANLIEFQVQSGIHALFVLGTVGEGILLAPEERTRIVEFVHQRVAGRVPIMAHCGAPDTRSAVDLARHAEGFGVDAVAVIAPFYYRHDAAALYQHFRTIADAAPDVSVYVYDNPPVVGYSVGADLVTRLVDDVANIRGVKDTGDSVGRMTSYLAQSGEVEVYAGSNVVILPALAIGARGAVSAFSNVVPELLIALYTAWDTGRLADARALQLTVARLQASVAGVPYIGALKHLATLRGLVGGALRAPLVQLDPDQAADLERKIKSVDDLAPWLRPCE